jgi:hypothetical protein
MTPKNAAKLAKRNLNDRTIAALLRLGKEPAYTRISELMTRPEALATERATLTEFLARGFLLTNWHHNPMRHRDVKKAVDAILSKRIV